MLLDNNQKYGLISKFFHWLSAPTIIALYVLGKWMEDLDYYHEWYHSAPHIHKSIGILLAFLTLCRVAWKVLTPSPTPIEQHSKNIQRLSRWVHTAMYVLLIIAIGSGYLISTADGRSIDIFNLFSIASLGELFEQQEDIAGFIHEQATNGLILLAIIHIVGAIKHLLIDRDNTFSRIWK